MKKLAIAISAILATGTVYAGNEATTSLENSTNDYVQIDQSSPGIALADGNDAVVNFKYSSNNVVFIDQEGNRNSAVVDGAIPGVFPTDDNYVEINQDGDDNHSYVQFKGADENFVDVNVSGNGNETYSYFTGPHADDNDVFIDVVDSDGNTVTTTVKSAFGNSQDNTVDVDITGASNDNTVTVAQRRDENIAEVTISGASLDNLVNIDQGSHENYADIDISGASERNFVYVDQNGRDSFAGVTIQAGSADNMVDITQTTNDYASVTMTNSQLSSVYITQN
ncbi:hypothetical protein AKJ18_10025 [Vibrio xuii]|nr:hypothetical protein AKJ18_10025 [Vibrio xuii]